MNQVARQDQLPGMPEPAGLLEVISRAASDPVVDITKMERLMEMYERVQAKNAEAAFNAAMTKAQSEMGRISADSENKQTHSVYASYAKLDKVLRPIYTANGFALSFDEGESEAETALILCNVSHSTGHSKVYRKKMPADGKGAKGGDVMTKTHASGAAMSYGMRYLLKGIFNVAIGEEDNDGNDDVAMVSDEQVANIKALMEEVGADRAKFFAYLKIKALSEIPAGNYAYVVKLLEGKRGK